MKRKVYPSICLVAALFLSSTASAPVHAQFIGKVCLTSPGATACPSSPPALGGNVGAQTRIAVFIQDSDGLNGFDITLLASHTVLVPVGVDLTGSVLGADPTILVECLQGVLKVGSFCQSTDTIDTLHLAAVAALCLVESLRLPRRGFYSRPSTTLQTPHRASVSGIRRVVLPAACQALLPASS